MTEAVEILLAVHDETAKAFFVAPSVDHKRAVWLPKRDAKQGEPCGGFERWGRRAQTKLITIYAFSVPRLKAVELGLVA